MLLLGCRVHSLEDAGAFGLEVGVELAEVGRKMREVSVDQRFILVDVLTLHLLVQLETACIAPS